MEPLSVAKQQMCEMWKEHMQTKMDQMNMDHLLPCNMDMYYEFLNNMDTGIKFDDFVREYNQKHLQVLKKATTFFEVTHTIAVMDMIVSMVTGQLVAFFPRNTLRLQCRVRGNYRLLTLEENVLLDNVVPNMSGLHIKE